MQQLKRFFPLIAGFLVTDLIVLSVLRSGGTEVAPWERHLGGAVPASGLPS